MRQYIYIIGILLCLLTPQAGWAQQAEPLDIRLLETPIPLGKEWYQEQERLWKAELKKDKKNEKAWENYSFARLAQYGWFPSDSLKREIERVARECGKGIGKYIPGTRVYYETLLTEARLAKDVKAKEKALIGLLTTKRTSMRHYIHDVYLCFEEKRTEDLKRICKEWYNSGLYSNDMLFYCYNELVGLEPGAVVIAGSNVGQAYYALLQYGAGLFQKVEFVGIVDLLFPMLHKEFWERIGVDVQKELPDWAERKNCPGAQYLTEKLNRPVYCSQLLANKHLLKGLESFFYSEGLVLRYSRKPYNNLAAMRRNYEQNYLLDYLKCRWMPDGSYMSNSAEVSRNYIVSLSPLLRFYDASGDKNRAAELRSLLQGILDDSLDSKKTYREDEEAKAYERLFTAVHKQLQAQEGKLQEGVTFTTITKEEKKAQYQQLIDPVKP